MPVCCFVGQGIVGLGFESSKQCVDEGKKTWANNSEVQVHMSHETELDGHGVRAK